MLRICVADYIDIMSGKKDNVKGKAKNGGKDKPRLECFKYWVVRVDIPKRLIHDSTDCPASEAALDAAVAM